MKFKRIFFAAALFVVSATAMMAQQLPPIPQDEKVRVGKLDNGLTYYIRNNNWPEHKANFYIAQRVGAVWHTSLSTGRLTVRSISPIQHCWNIPAHWVWSSVAT